MRDLEELRHRFATAPEFATSPLYTALARGVAEDGSLLRLAARCRHGQYPTFLFFGAIHYLLLGGIGHELAGFYPSIVGADAGRPESAGPALASFCRDYEYEIRALIETRLVQTNAVQRSLALRLGLAAIARRVDVPVHLVEVGASAGIHLRFDRFGYTLGGHRFGDAGSPVQIVAECFGRVPDLDALAPIATATGIDLRPLDAADADDRRWLEALVWPDNQLEADLLRGALEVVSADPPTIRAGDAADICPLLAEELPRGEPRVVFTVATRMHVPAEQQGAFVAAIASLGESAPLYEVTLDRPFEHDPRPRPARAGNPVHLVGPNRTSIVLAVAGPRLDWIEPIEA